MAVVHSQYSETGTVAVDNAACTACGLCVEICPAEALKMEKGRPQVNPDSPFGCIACGHCMMACPEEGIRVAGRGVSPADLHPLPSREEMASAEALAALMAGRRSVRHFTAQEVTPEALERIVAMASSAPMGIPPWDVGVTIVSGSEKVQNLAGEIVKGYEGLLKIFRPWLLTALRPFFGRTTYERFRSFIIPLAEIYVNGRRQGRDLLFYDAPAVLIFSHSPYADAVDASIACTYAMLAAESMGLGTTMIGGAPPIIQRNRKLAASLAIPAGNIPSLALIVGHPAVSFARGISRRFSFVGRS